jgi:uncharacterized protein
MKAITSAVKRHPLVTFFGLAYAISYGFYVLPMLVPGFPFLFPFGSIIAAIITASITQGVAGLKELLSRCLRWRVAPRWYAAALLVPLAMGLAVAALNTLLGAPLPNLAQFGPWLQHRAAHPHGHDRRAAAEHCDHGRAAGGLARAAHIV